MPEKEKNDLRCPKCNSANIQFYKYLNIKTLRCNNCLYDEAEEYDIFQEVRTSQKEKGRYNPYKAGRKRYIIKK